MIRCVLILLVILCGCNPKTSDYSYTLSEKEKSADAILVKVAMQLKKQYGLVPRGTGGRMMDQIKRLRLMFDYPKPLTVEEARPLIVGSVNEFIAAVNMDERIRPYLANYPFTSKNIEITIILQDAQGRGVPDGDLLVIFASGGHIKYKMNDPVTDRYRLILEETFEEAEERIRQTASKTAFTVFPFFTGDCSREISAPRETSLSTKSS